MPTLDTPIRALAALALISAGALLLGFGLPAIAAIRSHVFFYSTMESLVSKQLPKDVSDRLDAFNKLQAGLTGRIAHIDILLLNATNLDGAPNLPELLALRRSYVNEQRNAKEPISIQPLYQHVTMYFWPIMYLCLGVIIFIFRPRALSEISWFRGRPIILLTFCIFLFSVLPIWVRNFGLRGSNAHQIVYVYSTYEVAPLSFFIQQINFAIFSLLLAILWQQWSTVSILTRETLSQRRVESELYSAFQPELSETVSNFLLQWQRNFVILSMGFILDTAIFWNQIFHHADLRFIPEAAIVYALWLLSTVLMAIPFWISWRAWRHNKLRAVWELVHAKPPESENLDAKLAALRDLDPVGSWNASAFALSVLSLFAAPLVQALLTRA